MVPRALGWSPSLDLLCLYRLKTHCILFFLIFSLFGGGGKFLAIFGSECCSHNKKGVCTVPVDVFSFYLFFLFFGMFLEPIQIVLS